MAPKNRLKSTPDISTKTEFLALVDDTAKLDIERRALTVDLDARLASVREEFDPHIKSLSERISANVIRAEKFADTHRGELFGSLKSSESALAEFGFRLGNPILKLLNSRWTWIQVLETLKAKAKHAFIRTKEEPDKDAMKANMTDGELAEVGCRIDQSETFFIEPKAEVQTEPRLTGEPKEVTA